MESVVLHAVVDQEMAKSKNVSIVAPKEFINDQQAHFTNLRIQDSYAVEQSGKFVKATRRLALDITQYLPYMSAMQNVTAADIIRFPTGWAREGNEPK